MDAERRAKIERDQAERERIRQEREALVEKVGKSIQEGISNESSYVKMRQESAALFRIVEQVILNAQRECSSRHQYCDSHSSLAGVSLSLDEIDAALSVIRRIRGI